MLALGWQGYGVPQTLGLEAEYRSAPPQGPEDRNAHVSAGGVRTCLSLSLAATRAPVASCGLAAWQLACRSSAHRAWPVYDAREV